MGVLRSLGSRTSSGGQEDQTSIQSIEDLRNLLDETLHFFAESRGKLYKTLSKMKDEVLFSKVDYIIAVNEMMKTGKEIVRHLLNTFHSDPGCLKDRDSRQVIKAHLGSLRKISTRTYFYLNMLLRRDGDINRKCFRKLRQKGLILLEENEFPKTSKKSRQNPSPAFCISQEKISYVMKLQKNAQTSAKMHEKQRKIKFSISGRFVCLSDSTTKVVLHRTDMPESGGDSKRKQTTQSATTPTPTSAGDSAAEESKRKSKPANVLSNFVHRVVAFFVRSR